MRLLILALMVAAVPFSKGGAAVRYITLPPETATLKQSALAGYTIAQQKCAICHSADYINLQPLGMTLTQWTAEMVKMQHSYGAPIDDPEIKLLGVYLTSAYGDATTVTAADASLTLTHTGASGDPPKSSVDTAAGAASKQDVNLILAHNACLSCHALQQKVVGPAYHDVAIKYKNDPDAATKVVANIRAGGSGKWGAVPMPPFPDLNAKELHALAEYVLQQ